MRAGSLQLKKIGPQKYLHTWADELSVAALALFPAPLSKSIFLCHCATKWTVMQLKFQMQILLFTLTTYICIYNKR